MCYCSAERRNGNEIKNEMIYCPSTRSADLALYDKKFEFPATQKFALKPKNSGKELYKYLIPKNCGLHFIRNDSKLDLLTPEPTSFTTKRTGRRQQYIFQINSRNSNETRFWHKRKDDNLFDKLATSKSYSTVKADRIYLIMK